MTRPVLVLRPQPGGDATAARARALGLEPIVVPLFRIVPRAWDWTDGAEALLVTSANAARAMGDVTSDISVYAVGEATAAALRAQGFKQLRIGSAGVAALVAQAAEDGVRRILHLAGEDRTTFDPGPIRIETQTVYAAEPQAPGPEFAAALKRRAVALLHSARGARRFVELAGPGRSVAALSPAVLAAGGPWLTSTVAERPTDDALLAAAARLCQG